VRELRHPELGHVILRADECQVFIDYVHEIDDALLASTYRDWKFLEDCGKGPEATWKREQCYAEIERRVNERQCGR
jgi:hypothetical protein